MHRTAEISSVLQCPKVQRWERGEGGGVTALPLLVGNMETVEGGQPGGLQVITYQGGGSGNGGTVAITVANATPGATQIP